MNLRLAANEVRVRLDRVDAEALARGESLGHELKIPGGALAWRVDPGAGVLGLAWVAGELVIGAPAAEVAMLLEGTSTRAEGLQAQVVAAPGAELSLLVEIDRFDGKRRR